MGYLGAMFAIAATILEGDIASLKHYLLVASHRFGMELQVWVFYLDRSIDLGTAAALCVFKRKNRRARNRVLFVVSQTLSKG